MPRNKPSLIRPAQSAAMRFALEQCLRPWDSVTEEWNLRSGENLCRARVTQIATRAEAKLRQALKGFAPEAQK